MRNSTSSDTFFHTLAVREKFEPQPQWPFRITLSGESEEGLEEVGASLYFNTADQVTELRMACDRMLEAYKKHYSIGPDVPSGKMSDLIGGGR